VEKPDLRPPPCPFPLYYLHYSIPPLPTLDRISFPLLSNAHPVNFDWSSEIKLDSGLGDSGLGGKGTNTIATANDKDISKKREISTTPGQDMGKCRNP
jgi:hypothetical protein